MPSRRTLSALVPVVMLLIGVPVAGAAPGAADPVEVAQSKRIDTAVAFASPIGEQFVFWAQQDPNAGPLSARVRDDGVLGATQDLVAEANLELPRSMAFDPAGRSFTSFGIATSGALGRQVARAPRGVFGAVQAAAGCGRFSNVAFGGPTGQLALACSSESTAAAPNDRVAYGVRTGIGPVGVTTLSSPAIDDAFLQPSLAWGADGTLAVAWDQRDTATTSSLRLSLRFPDGGSVSSSLVAGVVTAPAFVSLNSVVVLPDGRVIIAGGDDVGPFLKVRDAGAGGTLGPRVALGGADSSARDFAVDGAGTVHLLLNSESGGLRTLRTRTLLPDGTLTAPVPVAPPAAGLSGRLLVGPDGTQRVTLRAPDGVSVATRPPAGAFDTPVRVAGTDARSPSSALTSTGDVIVAWTREAAPDDDRVVLGGLDSGAPPTLTGVDAPTRALAGQTAAFTGAASDPMGLRTIGWDFGDGTSAGAGIAQHAYGVPGRYVATLTATDRAGNATTATRTVDVVAAATPPGPPATVVAPDRSAPTIRLTAPARISFATLRRRGVTVTARLDEPAALRGELVGRARRVTLRAVGDLTLGERSLAPSSARLRRLTLKPNAALRGSRRSVRLVLRVTATDAAGNRRTALRALRVRR